MVVGLLRKHFTSMKSKTNLLVFTRNTSSSPSSRPPQSLRDRMQNFLEEYGKVGVATHAALSALSLGGIYLGVRQGVDVASFVKTLGLPISDEIMANAGNFLLAFSVYKILAPIRWPLTFAVTPLVVRVMRSKGFTKRKVNNTN